jgi:spermidine synthase
MAMGLHPLDDATRRWSVLAAMLCLGVSAMMTQLVVMREMLSAFAGNELVLGIVLGTWLILTGLGTWAGQLATRCRAPFRRLTGGLVTLGLVPIGQVVALRTLRDVVFVRGSEVGLIGTSATSFLLLLPYCVLAGYLLAIGCALLSSVDGHRAAGRVYVADAVGSIAGGALLSLVLIHWWDHLTLLLVPALLNLAAAAGLTWVERRRVALVVNLALALGLSIGIVVLEPDRWTTAAQFRGQELLFHANSPYGRLVVTETAGQINVFENGLPALSTSQTERVEESVHYALAQRPDAKRVLLVSGGASGTAREILKYPVQEVIYVELDPLVLEVAQQFFPDALSEPRIHTVSTDARRTIQRAARQFDVVLLDLPDPSTLQLNRFYTAEFFSEVRKALAPNGVLGFGLGHYANYVGPELARLLASVHKTLKTAFPEMLIIPGSRVFFVASDAPLHANIIERMARHGISAQFVSASYLEAIWSADRRADMERAVSVAAPLNTDFKPTLCTEHLRHWLSQFGMRLGPVQVVLVATLIFCVARMRAIPLVVFASGYGASALQVVLLVAHQMLFGSVYQQVALILTAFMAGLAVGAWLANRSWLPPSRGKLAALSLAVVVLAGLLPLILGGLRSAAPRAVHPGLVQLGTPALAFGLALLVGMQFPVANRLSSLTAALAASRLYTADFLGASLGAYLASAWLLPTFGVNGVCWIIAGLNAWAVLALWTAKALK